MAINKSIEEKSFHTRPNLLKMFARAKSKNGRVHFLGLVSYCRGEHVMITHSRVHST